MAELKLRNCPFCGDNQQLNYVELSNGLHYIECARCGAAPHRLGAWNRETAVKYWNSVNRWIPCSERLPEPLQNVIVCTDIGTVTVAWLNGDHWTFADTGNGHTENWSFEAVKYWMHLPEPPKGEQNEQN